MHKKETGDSSKIKYLNSFPYRIRLTSASSFAGRCFASDFSTLSNSPDMFWLQTWTSQLHNQMRGSNFCCKRLWGYVYKNNSKQISNFMATVTFIE